MARLSLFVCIVLLSFCSKAQDTLPKWKPNFQLDNRVSSIRNNSIVLIGAKLGFQYKNLTRIGIGSSFILKPVEFEYINQKTGELVRNKADFWYFSIYNDWIIYKNHNLEIFITEQIGYGKPKYSRGLGDEVLSESKVDLYINELSTQANYKITPIVGVGIGIGYRNLFNKKSLLNPTFDAPLYMAKLIIYPRELWDRLQKRKAESMEKS